MGQTTRVILLILAYLAAIGVLYHASTHLVENDYCKGSGLLKQFMHEHSISVMVTITAIYVSLAFIMLGNSPANHDKKALLGRNFEVFVTFQGAIMVLLPMRQLVLLSKTSIQEMRECSDTTTNLLYFVSSNLELQTFNFLLSIISLYFLAWTGLVITLISKKKGKNEA